MPPDRNLYQTGTKCECVRLSRKTCRLSVVQMRELFLITKIPNWKNDFPIKFIILCQTSQLNFIWLNGSLFYKICIREVQDISNCYDRCWVNVDCCLSTLPATAPMFSIKRTERVHSRVGLSSNNSVVRTGFTKWSTNWVFRKYFYFFLNRTVLEISF